MKREILIPITILALALLAAAGAPAVGVIVSNAAFGAETTVFTASLGAEGGDAASAARFLRAARANDHGEACR
jgi:NAD(P)H-hydrate repair Nnr-like enzyme with NAD(P)H-hydrate epimerase domain